MLAQLLRRKSIDEASADAEAPEGRLKRSLGPIDLTALGIGAIIGAGIFSATGSRRRVTSTPRAICCGREPGRR